MALLALAAFLAGLARGFSGFGAALIFVPLASALLEPRMAGPILLLIDAIFASYLVPAAWSKGNRREVSMMLVGAAAGVPLGTIVLKMADPVTLRWIITVLAALLLLLLIGGWRYRGRPHWTATLSVGGVSGLFSGIAQIGGPPVISYWLGTEDDMGKVRANVILFFMGGNILSFVSYWGAHLITGPVLSLALIAGPPYGMGTYAGSHMFGFASPRSFRLASLALIAIAVLIGAPVFGR
jgi:uncharacterized protein